MYEKDSMIIEANDIKELIGFYVGVDLGLSGIFSNHLFVPLLGGFWIIGSLTLFYFIGIFSRLSVFQLCINLI